MLFIYFNVILHLYFWFCLLFLSEEFSDRSSVSIPRRHMIYVVILSFSLVSWSWYFLMILVTINFSILKLYNITCTPKIFDSNRIWFLLLGLLGLFYTLTHLTSFTSQYTIWPYHFIQVCWINWESLNIHNHLITTRTSAADTAT